ncbi:MAG: polysaccharide pyruvyl transferase family protein [Bacteroides sp.]|nr:polysaccharide pyruvyl transferase family protein [Bacteroides sp.]
MKHYLLYAHGGAYNHGSEASVKCDIALLRKISPDCKITLSSHFPEQDRQFNIDADEIIGRDLNGKTNEEIYAETISRITPETVCLSVGGDCYCYPNWQRYACIHKKAIEKGAKSILWSCSVEPSMIDGEMLEVLRSHTLITARESVTFNALKELGLTNVVLTSDIAFTLEPIKTDIPPERYVVLNLSPLVVRRNPKVLTAYQRLVDEILSKTDLNIALLPHVEVSVDNDFEALSQLHSVNGSEDRIYRIPVGLSAAEYKYIISKSEVCVAARTHACIAAWSSGVPVLAVGYSAKAKGIARDLGQEEYVADLSCVDEERICKLYSDITNSSEHIRALLSKKAASCRKGVISDPVINMLKTER